MLVVLRKFPAVAVWLESMSDEDVMIGCGEMVREDIKAVMLHLAKMRQRKKILSEVTSKVFIV